MVISRKPARNPKSAAPTGRARPTASTPERRKRETIDQLMERIMSEPIGTPLNITKRQAIAVLRRLAGSDPDARPGQEIIDEFYGLNPDGSIKRGRPKKQR